VKGVTSSWPQGPDAADLAIVGAGRATVDGLDGGDAPPSPCAPGRRPLAKSKISSQEATTSRANNTARVRERRRYDARRGGAATGGASVAWERYIKAPRCLRQW